MRSAGPHLEGAEVASGAMMVPPGDPLRDVDREWRISHLVHVDPKRYRRMLLAFIRGQRKSKLN